MKTLTTEQYAEYKRLRQVFLEAENVVNVARSDLQLFCPHNEGTDQVEHPMCDMPDEFCNICGKQLA
jgi:hypothetical protein